jgi:hypothetical protein
MDVSKIENGWQKIDGVLVNFEWTDNMDEWQGGYAKGPFIKVRTKYKERNDAGIVLHEVTHTKQWWEGWYTVFLLHPLSYLISEDYRYDAEIEAYKKQLDCYNTRFNPPTWCVEAICTKYRLNVTPEQVIADLAK